MKAKNKKFSIIVPVYNVEKYLKKCLDSILIQTYDNYEVIIVCDKSDDNSEIIVDEYIKKNKNFKKIFEINTGLSKARNIGISNATGDYLLFLDSDDFFEKDLLKTLHENFEDNPEVIRFQVQQIKEDKVIPYPEKPFKTIEGVKAFEIIQNYHYIENAWCYCYELQFWKNNNFIYVENCLAEDYGLTPLILALAKKVKSLNYIGYNYVKRKGSLMNNNDYSKRIKKMNDLILQSDLIKNKIINISRTDSILRFINNSLIYYSTTLEKKDYKKYNKILKNKNCFDYLETDSIKHKIKKIIIKNNSWFFYNYLKRFI